MTSSPLKVWIIIQEDGSVRSSHCTCMAGAAEACSHIAAVLYYLEHINASRNTVSCTDVKALWRIPTVKKVSVVKLSELQWTTSKTTSTRGKKYIPSIEGVELQEMLTTMEGAGTSAAVMRVVDPFATSVATQRISLLPTLYNNLYRSEYESKSLDELINLSSQVPQLISEEDCVAIENATKNQSKSREWYNQRSGRVTASRFKNVCKTSITKPSLSLIKIICYPVLHNFKSKATNWGIIHEDDAVRDYINNQRLIHENFIFEKCGLLINPSFPQFGASPDGISSCSCCGRGTVEVKCPYILRNGEDIQSYAANKNACLTFVDDNIILKRNHAYFYQVQMQMKIANLNFSDFIVWSPKEFFIERIYFNEDFWACEYPKAAEFHQKVILPELLGRYFTSDISISWCWCKTSDDDRPMIKCENDACEIQWFHLDCLGLSDVPDTLWICNFCKNNPVE